MVNTETLNTLKKQSKQTPLRLLAIIRTLSWLYQAIGVNVIRLGVDDTPAIDDDSEQTKAKSRRTPKAVVWKQDPICFRWGFHW